MQPDKRDTLFLCIARAFAMESTCLRGHTGAVIALHNRIIATGYNGAPAGLPHCTEVGCGGGVEKPWPKEGRALLSSEQLRKYVDGEGNRILDFPHGCTRSTHAEANAIALCARYGTPCDGGTMYCTHSPCVACAHAMGAAGIKRVVFAEYYRIKEPLQMLEELGMEVHCIADRTTH